MEERGIPLSHRTTIAVGELYAILTGTQSITEEFEYYLNEYDIIHIVTDSETSRDLILNEKQSKDEINVSLIDQIQKIIHILHHWEITVNIQWTPSHSNIKYNEKVDNTAKEGADLVIDNTDSFKFISYVSIKNEVKLKAAYKQHQNWENYINTTKWSIHLRDWEITENAVFIEELEKLSRTEYSIIYKLYTMHLQLNHFRKHRYNQNDDKCLHCEEIEDIEHYMMECNQYKEIRIERDRKLKELYRLNDITYNGTIKELIYPNDKLMMESRIIHHHINIDYTYNTKRFKKWKEL